MQFGLGFIAGLVTATFIAGLVAFFRSPIDKVVATLGAQIKSVGPRPKGYVFEPEDDADIVREEVIARNREQGKDTNISELL